MDAAIVPVTPDEKEQFLVDLEKELLIGGVMMSTASEHLIADAARAWIAGANLSTVLTAQAAVEAFLRWDLSIPVDDRTSYAVLLPKYGCPEDLYKDLERVRRYRNQWTHARDGNEPQEDLELMGRLGVVSAMRFIHLHQWS